MASPFPTTNQYFEHALAGRLTTFHVASQALLLAATTGGHPTVINPYGSDVIFVPTSLRVCFTSGTTVIGSVLLAETLNVSQVATGAPIATATLVTPKNAYRGSRYGTRLQWSPTTNTFTAAPAVIAATGINLGAVAPSAGSGSYECLFNGDLVFGEGTALSVVFSVTTSTALFHVTIAGLELPSSLAA